MDWPDLPTDGFLAGRAATDDDIRANCAVFSLKAGDEAIGSPLDIPIPQYAIHINTEEDTRTPCIVIQAEEGGPSAIIGVRYLDGERGVGLLHEFELLGKDRPSPDA